MTAARPSRRPLLSIDPLAFAMRLLRLARIGRIRAEQRGELLQLLLRTGRAEPDILHQGLRRLVERPRLPGPWIRGIELYRVERAFRQAETQRLRDHIFTCTCRDAGCGESRCLACRSRRRDSLEAGLIGVGRTRARSKTNVTSIASDATGGALPPGTRTDAMTRTWSRTTTPSTVHVGMAASRTNRIRSSRSGCRQPSRMDFSRCAVTRGQGQQS